ncbi:glycoside hydrolase family 2 TIM barrel-domain containing protein [Amycolatopsis sp. NPDC059657]|uniref:glycoside hydrolase family 2 TIM barrel-domain containing protein n=1 Tax=Amycolatopsis sp. NPDC059657 TaxID=3346899 RepID=UPI003672931A
MSLNHRTRRLPALVLCLVTTLGLVGVPAQAAPLAEAVSSASREVDFTQGWNFSLVNTTGADAPQPGTADPSWREVRLPHDWSIGLDPLASPATNAGTAFLPGGLGWYRKAFRLPRAMAGKQVSIEFDGVYMDSEVYLNGRLLGAHAYGYTGFSLDLTPFAHTDGTADVLTVKVRNQVPSSRWYSGSGIYRAVRLVVTDPVHLTRHGIAVTTPDLANTVKAGFANVHVDATAVTTHGGTQQAQVVSTVRDAGGRVVGSGSAQLALTSAPGTGGMDIRVPAPNLWSTDRPYLYTVDTELLVAGKRVDLTTTPLGIRWFVFDPAEGFSLNGEPMKLQGVNLHHDLGALGSAVNTDAIVRQLKIMKSMGVNAIRTSHNPPAPELIKACAEMGIVMMVEAFDTWRTPKTKNDYARFFDANSTADVQEMVLAARNSPAVVLWSIGNEIPDSTTAAGVPIAQRLIENVRAVDTTRPIVMGSDRYRSVPAPGSPQDRILQLLDGVGLNYNTAASVDALHARYPTKFFFESESSSSTSTRGVYQDPDQLNTGENHTPGKRGTSSYDNNLESWTYSGEYGLKKDRDRKFFAGQFLWTGIDYLGEPTPYANDFPVKASFFGAVDTAGFAKDFYHLFRSQWSSEPMVHLLPMNWTDHQPGEQVSVWAYSNADTVELFLNGTPLGARKFDTKTTTSGTKYLETTEATGDDKTVTTGAYPGSYTSPNGSAGKLHLTWTVPFEPGRLVAVAKRGGVEVARDEVSTAGTPRGIRLTPDRKVLGNGTSLAFITADIVDERGVVVPQADNMLSFDVRGGRLAGLDNGQEESAENYQASSRKAFNGKALAIVAPGSSAGPVVITARSPGLRTALTTVLSGGGGTVVRPSLGPSAPPKATRPSADASYSGAANTIPAAMLDGNTVSGGWSNYYTKRATALLPAVSRAHTTEWVSVSGLGPGQIGNVQAYFTTDTARALPAAIDVSYWDGQRFLPVRGARIEWATGSNQPTRITFEPVHASRIKLAMTSRAPGTATGFLQIAELTYGP